MNCQWTIKVCWTHCNKNPQPTSLGNLMSAYQYICRAFPAPRRIDSTNQAPHCLLSALKIRGQNGHDLVITPLQSH